jgi:hypothetical protein
MKKSEKRVTHRIFGGHAFETCPPKTYGKQAFTPEVPAQVLRKGKLVPITEVNDG